MLRQEEQQHHFKQEHTLANNPIKQHENNITIAIITTRVDVQTLLLQLNGLNQYVHDSKQIKQSLSFVPISPIRYPPLESRIWVSVLSSRNCRIPSSRHGITFLRLRCSLLLLDAP